MDFSAGVIRVEKGWDDIEGEIETKGKSRRRVRIIPTLREALAAHLLRSRRRDDDLVFGVSAASPFDPHKLQRRADAAWKQAGLERITLHPCRHTYASFLIAAGVNAKAVSTYLGHASIQTTYDLYGHLMPGSEAEAGDLLDAFLTRRTETG